MLTVKLLPPPAMFSKLGKEIISCLHGRPAVRSGAEDGPSESI